MGATQSTRVPPTYRLHRPSGQAIVRIDGHTHYLGTWQSPESRARYGELVIEKLGQRPQSLAEQASRDPDRRIEDLIAAYWQHAQDFYKDSATGIATSQLAHIKLVVRHLRHLYADLKITDFGPLKLAEWRDFVTVWAVFVEKDGTRRVEKRMRTLPDGTTELEPLAR